MQNIPHYRADWYTMPSDTSRSACVIVNAEILKNRREPPVEDQPRYIKFIALLFLVK